MGIAVMILIDIIVLLILGIVVYKTIQNTSQRKIELLEKEAEDVLEKAKRDSEATKKEAILEAKEEVHKLRNDFDKESRERRNEVQRLERRVIQREEAIDKKNEILEKKEQTINERMIEVEYAEAKVQELENERRAELEKISALSSEEAREILLDEIRKEITHDVALMIKDIEGKAKDEADKRAREIITTAIQRCAADHVSETTVHVVTLPNDEMKGRIIGREGRNIRTIESVTGVDLIIDDTPEAIVISSFDPLRREIARLTLETLIKDGRIHPARIEELYAKTCSDVRGIIKEYGKNALYELGLSKMDPELVEIVGKLHFRSSYGQNALSHSIEVANLAGLLAAEIGENVNLAKRAGLLHDIGKAIDFEMEGSHVKIGVDLAKKYGEDEVVINAIASHHGDTEPTSIISSIVAIADTISASRPGARNDSSENYIQRLEQLEEIGNQITGVEKAYAVQAGRELRVMVKPEEIDDLTAHQIAREIKEKIESQMQYPGTIKVTVIRETRATEEAK